MQLTSVFQPRLRTRGQNNHGLKLCGVKVLEAQRSATQRRKPKSVLTLYGGGLQAWEVCGGNSGGGGRRSPVKAIEVSAGLVLALTKPLSHGGSGHAENKQAGPSQPGQNLPADCFCGSLSSFGALRRFAWSTLTNFMTTTEPLLLPQAPSRLGQPSKSPLQLPLWRHRSFHAACVAVCFKQKLVAGLSPTNVLAATRGQRSTQCSIIP